jgi:hypothetical protein
MKKILQQLQREQKTVEFVMVTGHSYAGKVTGTDDDEVSIHTADGLFKALGIQHIVSVGDITEIPAWALD